MSRLNCFKIFHLLSNCNSNSLKHLFNESRDLGRKIHSSSSNGVVTQTQEDFSKIQQYLNAPKSTKSKR